MPLPWTFKEVKKFACIAAAAVRTWICILRVRSPKRGDDCCTDADEAWHLSASVVKLLAHHKRSHTCPGHNVSVMDNVPCVRHRGVVVLCKFPIADMRTSKGC